MTTLITSNSQVPSGPKRTYSGVATEADVEKTLAEHQKKYGEVVDSWWWKEQKYLYVEVKE